MQFLRSAFRFIQLLLRFNESWTHNRVEEFLHFLPILSLVFLKNR